MASQRYKKIDPDNSSGTDFTSIASLEAENMDLVTDDVYLDAEFFCTSGTADTSTDTAFNGWESDATRYINLYTNSAYRHPGYWDTSKYRLTASGNYGDAIIIADIGSGDGTIYITGFQLSVTTGAGNAYCVTVNNIKVAKLRVSYCLMKSASTGARAHGMNVSSLASGGEACSFNNILYDFDNSNSNAIRMGDAGGHFYCESDTVLNSYTGVRRVSGDMYVKNCLVKCYGYDTDYTDLTGSFTAEDYNAVSDTSASGAHSRTEQTFTFENEGSDDFRLSSSDTGAKGYGTSTVHCGFTDDITGWTRGATWDIGAYQITNRSAGGGVFQNTDEAMTGGLIPMSGGMQ